MTASALRRRAPQAPTAAAVAATIVMLHLMGRGTLAAPPLDSPDSIIAWAGQGDPVTVGFAVLRLAALAVAYHLVATTMLMLIGRMLGVQGLVRLADAATLPPLRGTVRRLVGLGLSAGLVITQPLPTAQARPPASLTLVSSGIAADPDNRVVLERISPATERPAVLMVVERIDLPATPGGRATLERVEAPTDKATRATLERIEIIGDQGGDHLKVGAAEDPPPSPEPEPVATTRHVVTPGDHLWSIASDQLAAAMGREPTDAEIAPHWTAVVELNPQLVDPDVLFPGDEISLPPAPMG